MTDPIMLTTENVGCHLDNHRGHYISRDVIDMATGWGFIISPTDEFAVRMYDSADSLPDGVEYPHESITEICDEAVAWLNSGTGTCENCNGSGRVRIDGRKRERAVTLDDPDGVICMKCSGHGRGNRISGQNFPPIRPEGTSWGFNDGDFGLYPDLLFSIWYADEKIGSDLPLWEARACLTAAGAPTLYITRLLDQDGDGLAVRHGNFAVQAVHNDN